MERDSGACEKDYFKNMLKTLIGNKDFFIWSACHKSDWLWKVCESAKIGVSGYIDKRAADVVRFHDLKVFEPDEILGNKNCFVFIALENVYTDIINLLTGYGLHEFQDYLYPGCRKSIIAENYQRYRDFNGNEILGDVNGFRVLFLQGGSRLIIGKGCDIDRSVLITLARNATIVIGDNCVIKENCKIECTDNAVIEIGDHSSIGEGARIRVNCDATLTIGYHFTCVRNLWIRAGWKAVCVIGEDCMFARDADLQCMDAHNYFDLNKNINLNSLKQYKINIGNHVWVGAGCKFLCGTDIGAGSMVGMGSFVNKKFPNNVIIAGNPAECVRENVAWNHDSYPFYNDKENFELFDFRETR